MICDVQERSSRVKSEKGFTLLEVTLAMAMFALIMTGVAQFLAGFSLAMNFQQQRHEATQHCRAILAQMRQDRDNSVVAFPNQILQQWPNNSQVADPALVSLPNEVLTVTYANTNADPLSVTVRSTWTDRQGRAMQAQVSTLLTGTVR